MAVPDQIEPSSTALAPLISTLQSSFYKESTMCTAWEYHFNRVNDDCRFLSLLLHFASVVLARLLLPHVSFAVA